MSQIAFPICVVYNRSMSNEERVFKGSEGNPLYLDVIPPEAEDSTTQESERWWME